jgi:hypothetical protein
VLDGYRLNDLGAGTVSVIAAFDLEAELVASAGQGEASARTCIRITAAWPAAPSTTGWPSRRDPGLPARLEQPAGSSAAKASSTAASGA